jgi:uncharacterized protein (TIGR02594 family)
LKPPPGGFFLWRERKKMTTATDTLNGLTFSIFNILYIVALLAIYIGEKWQQHTVIGIVREALQRAQAAPDIVPPVVAPHAPVPIPVPLPKITPATAPKVAAPSGPFGDYPKWFQSALHEIGNREDGANQGAAVQRYINMANCGALGDPWCAIFANAMLEGVGIAGTRSPSSQSFRNHPNFVPLSGPAKGALTIYWRSSPSSGMGHVGFYRGEDASRVWTLGGNEDDMVQIEALPKSSATFGLIGYWWPKSEPLPQIGPVLMAVGSPVSVQVSPSDAPAGGSQVQTNIIATWFGGQQSAYGPPIDDNSCGVALPYHFSGDRPRVRVRNPRTGASVDCDIVDVGPWNINDPYWLNGARPQAESGMDLGQVSNGVPRKTNGAGIDLTLAAAKALGIDGKGAVEWQFINAPI